MNRLTATLLTLLVCFSGYGGEDATVVPRPAVAKDIDVPKLKAALRSVDFAAVEKAAAELADSQNPAAILMFWTLYNDGDAQRRLLAVRSIGRLGLRGTEQNLFVVSVQDMYQGIRRAAAEALAKIETRATATARYIAAAKDKKLLNPVGRYRSLYALACLGGQPAADALKEWLSSDEPDMAMAAADNLGLLGDQSQCEALISALGVTNIEVKGAAADALERLTSERNGYNLVKWSTWLNEYKANRPAVETGGVLNGPAPMQRYDDPYNVPLTSAPVDVMVVFDTTGSMASIWPELQADIDNVLRELVKVVSSMRVGTIKYRTAMEIIPRPLTRNYDNVVKEFKESSFGGASGGLHNGLLLALNAATWRPHARKVVILVGDVTPSGDGPKRAMQMIKEAWEVDHILVSTLFVKSAGHGEQHRDTYALMAKAGAGRFYEYNKAERHLVEMSADKVDIKKAEENLVTGAKWCSPRERP